MSPVQVSELLIGVFGSLPWATSYLNRDLSVAAGTDLTQQFAPTVESFQEKCF
jgi:hypothetical protein